MNCWTHSNPNLQKMKQALATTNLAKMQIDTCNSDPVPQKPYPRIKGRDPIAMKHYDRVKDDINKLLDVKVICCSHYSWWAPIIIVPKGDGGKCLDINYRALNKGTCKFIWPMSKIEDIFSKLNGVKYFSKFDFWVGYYHIPLNNASIPKKSFHVTFWQIWVLEISFWTSTSTCILLETYEEGVEGPAIHYHLPRWHNYLE